MHPLVFAAVLLLVGLLNADPLGERKANQRFTFENGTYEISTSRAGWTQAKSACKALGMQLVAIETFEENSAILEAIVLMPGESFWTSGSDLGHEGNFYWEATGRILGPWAYWAPDEPSGDDDEHCVQLWHDANHLWNDVACDHELLYICELQPCQ